MVKGFEIINRDSILNSLNEYRIKGAVRGIFLGFPNLSEFYTMAVPGVTDVTGFPASGKSEFVLELLLNASILQGWKHLLYVPDVGDKNEIFAILIHKLSGKTFDERYKHNYITENEMNHHLEFILHHFFVLTQVDLKCKITPYEFWDLAAEMKKTHNIQTATIDSWKDLRHNVAPNGDNFNRDDKFLEDVLSYRNSMAELHKLQFITIIHPTKTEADKDGKRKPPTPYDLKGGSEWYNNGKCMITVHRTSGSENEVDIMITKAKPKSVAKVGTVKLYYDFNSSSYYYLDENNNRCFRQQKNQIMLASKIEEDDNDIPF